jgi:hypothetical protein
MRIFIFGLAFISSVFSPKIAEAGEVAVLQFDGYGVSFDDASLVSEGVRSAFLEVGDYFPVEAWDFSERMADSTDPTLREARSKYAEGVVEFRAGRYRSSISSFEASIDAHMSVGSHYARREQLADVYFHIGRAQFQIGASTGAMQSFEHVARLYPQYLETRHRGANDSLSGSVRAMISRASSELDAAPRSLPSEVDLQEIALSINVDAIVAGYISADGQIFAQMVSRGRIIGDVNEVSQDVPPFPGDPIFITMVESLLGGVGGVQEPSPVESSTQFASNPFGTSGATSSPVPSFVEQSTNQRPPERCVDVWWQVWKTCEATGPLSYASKPVTEEWWFWTATGVAVVGGGVYAWNRWAPESEDPEDVIVDGNSYTLNVDIP